MNHATPDLAGVLRRLERLERQNRLWKIFGLLVLLSLGGAGLAGAAFPQAVPDTIVAKEFKLVDAKGKIRAQLFMMEAGQPAIAFLDEKGKERMTMHIAKNGPRFVCLAPSGDRSMGVWGADENGGFVNLWNTANQVCFVANASNTAAFPKLAVMNEKGRDQVRLAVSKEGTEVTCFDPAAKIMLLQVGGSVERGGFVTGRDLDGNVIFGMTDKGLHIKK
jgi:hypothetical protein